jgi:hypothetical protein
MYNHPLAGWNRQQKLFTGLFCAFLQPQIKMMKAEHSICQVSKPLTGGIPFSRIYSAAKRVAKKIAGGICTAQQPGLARNLQKRRFLGKKNKRQKKEMERKKEFP